MKPIKKVLIICDAHDCIRHQGNYTLLLKQLYVAVFLLKKHFGADEYTLHINNRAAVGFEVFWQHDSTFYTFLTEFIIQKPWSDINMPDYDLIITHPDYQKDLQNHFLKAFGIANPSNIYSFSELQYHCHMIFPSTVSLITKGGLLEFDWNAENEAALLNFEREFDQSTNRFGIDEQEAAFPQLDQLVENFNHRMRIDKINNVLILDDYKRGFFIADSVYWMSKIKKLIDIFPEQCCVSVNLNNIYAFTTISGIFQKSLPERITITNYGWAEIDLKEYDLILCNNDVLLKFHWYMNQNSWLMPGSSLIYSFSVMEERPIKKKATMDFYTNIFYSSYANKLEQAAIKLNENIFNEISLLKEEHVWANGWLENKGVLESDKLIVLLHEASSSDKVIYDSELLKLIKHFSRIGNHIKILLICEKSLADNNWLNGALANTAYNKVVVAESLQLREVMSLLGNNRIAAIIGPCTGLMHLADSIYAYLLRHKVIAEPECPLLLTYAGKQDPQRNYHPGNWWKHSSNVCCVVCMSAPDESENKRLMPLEDCPPDFESFNNQSVSAREINCDMLVKFINEKFPELFTKPGHWNFSNLNFHDLALTRKMIPTFIINLKQRVERRNHILKQFSGKSAFDCTLVEAIENENGRLGLWQTIKKIVSDNINSDHEYILIVEDDHEFTPYYSDRILMSCIDESRILNADILLGGICFCDKKVKQVHDNLVSLEHFACTQFTIIFKPFFKKILEANFTEMDCADWKMARLSNRKLVIYPFISKQKDFGYADVSSEYYENKMSIHVNATSKIIQDIIKYKVRERKVTT